MPVFVFKGINRMGQMVTGERAAPSEEDVRRALLREGIQISYLKKKGFELKLPRLKKAASLKELAIFTRQLSVMVNAGLAIDQALAALAEQQSNKRFKAVLEKVTEDVRGGSSLSNAFAKHPEVFDCLYVNMVAAGETGGTLDIILQRLADYLEKIKALVSKIKSALAYPIAVLTIAILITAFILWKVIPAFAKLYHDLGAELPLPTQIVISTSNFLIHQFYLWMGGLIGLFLLYKFYVSTPGGRRTVDKLKLKLWVIGPLILKGALAKVMRTLATLVTSGVDILLALDISAKTAGNTIIEKLILDAREEVAAGKSLSEPLRKSPYIPVMISQMVEAGEATGALDTMLNKIADFYEEEVDSAVSALISVMEPIMVLFLGGLVGGIVLSMYLPIFNLLGRF